METTSSPGAIKSADDVRAMFDRIVRRYDLMNRIMTGGQDRRWRRKAVAAAMSAGSDHALDLATGTGDLALALAEGGYRHVVGLDFSTQMIDAAESKRAGRDHVHFLVGNALRLPFADDGFDACTVSFGLRNMPDYGVALREFARVIRPGGRLVCLELTPLHTPVIGALFNAYFTHVVPFVGGKLSGDSEAYAYLPLSVAAFPNADALAALMRAAGFGSVTVERYGCGTVALHVATKPDR